MTTITVQCEDDSTANEFIAWFLDGGGEYNFGEFLYENGYEIPDIKWNQPKNQITIKAIAEEG